MSEALHIRPMPDDSPCEVHAWSLDDLRRRLVPLMRERHGKGGVTLCRECIARAVADQRARLASPPR